MVSKTVLFFGRKLRSRTILNYLSLRENQNLKSADILCHCASLGEHQSLVPVLEKIRSNFPIKKIALSFFSPSGYLNVKARNIYDFKIYCPVDQKSEVDIFLDQINPSLIIISQNEIWPLFLAEIVRRGIPCIYIDSYFNKTRRNKLWFWLNQSSLSKVKCFFTQNKEVSYFLKGELRAQAHAIGSIRKEYIDQSLSQKLSLPKLELFSNSKPLIVFGSVHNSDIYILSKCIDQIIEKYNILIAPHDINDYNLRLIKKKLKDYSISFYSRMKKEESSICVLDEFGVLKFAYHYAEIVYIGGGFNKGIHNVLEPAYFLKPIIVGPNFSKFQEAKELNQRQVLFEISNSNDLINKIEFIANHREEIQESYSTYQELYHSPSQFIVNFIRTNKLI